MKPGRASMLLNGWNHCSCSNPLFLIKNPTHIHTSCLPPPTKGWAQKQKHKQPNNKKLKPTKQKKSKQEGATPATSEWDKLSLCQLSAEWKRATLYLSPFLSPFTGPSSSHPVSPTLYSFLCLFLYFSHEETSDFFSKSFVFNVWKHIMPKNNLSRTKLKCLAV